MDDNKMNDNKDFENFFDSIGGSAEEAIDVKKKETPKEMLTDPESPPPSPHDIDKFKDDLSKFDNMVEVCREGLESLSLGENEYREFDAKFKVRRINFSEDSTPNELSKQLCMIQIMKDDMLGLIAEAHSNYLMRKRYADILLNTYNSVSQQKTADKRKGDAHLRLFEFIKGCSDAEAFYVKCRYYYENLESQHKTISRRITCMQSQLALREMSTLGEDSQIEIQDDTAPREVDWGK